MERVNAGLTRAKREGKTLGRPRVIVDREKALRLSFDLLICFKEENCKEGEEASEQGSDRGQRLTL